MSGPADTARPATMSGTCHCGAIRVTLAFSRPLAELQVRACQCGFCARHGAMTVTDPAGHVVIEFDRACAGRYRFGTGTSTSLVCRTCGVYVGAILETEGLAWSTINLRGLGLAAAAGRVAEPVVYDSETAAGRTARRRARWTPTEIRDLP